MINPHTEWNDPVLPLLPLAEPPAGESPAFEGLSECVKVCLHNFIKITVKNFTYAHTRGIGSPTPWGRLPPQPCPCQKLFKFKCKTPSPISVSLAQLSIGILQVSKIFQAWKCLPILPAISAPLSSLPIGVNCFRGCGLRLLSWQSVCMQN